MNGICNACNKKIDEINYLKDRTVSKNCYNKNRRKSNNNLLIQNQQPKIDYTIHRKPIIKNDFENKTCHRHLIIGGSGHGKTYLMNHILHKKQKKQGPFFIITKSLNQYLYIKAQTSDDIQLLENYENSTVVLDDKLLSKQESNIDPIFTRGRQNNIDIDYKSQSYFHLRQKLFVVILI